MYGCCSAYFLWFASRVYLCHISGSLHLDLCLTVRAGGFQPLVFRCIVISPPRVPACLAIIFMAGMDAGTVDGKPGICGPLGI